MNLEKILQELDSLPGGADAEKTGDFLKDKISLARQEGDHASELALLNEMIGYCRYMGLNEDSEAYSNEALKLCEEQGLAGQIPYATTLLNAATADRAAGRLDESLGRYREVEDIYGKQLDKSDYLYAALYNNMSLLYQAMDRHEESAEYLKKALGIISTGSEHKAEQAITLTNLGQAYIRLGRYEDAASSLKDSERIFEELGGDEFHYPGCLNAMAQLLYIKKDYEGSVRYYEKALMLLKRHVGEDNPGYIAVLENMKEARRMAGSSGDIQEEVKNPAVEEEQRTTETQKTKEISEPKNEVEISGPDEDISINSDTVNREMIKGLDLSRKFYEEYGAKMIHEEFPEYEDRMTIGLVGRGSQCYGFDDEMSSDHDFGPDFCIWLDNDVYSKAGDDIQKAYDKLPKDFMGYSRVNMIPPDGRRVGVIRTKEFYSRILDIGEDFLDAFLEADKGETVKIYDFFASVKEENLSQCTNGEIFKEGTGDFIRIRSKLSYYPDTIWKRKIAEELHYSAQMGQYNYIRMLKRGEKVASEIALAGYMEHTMKLVYLINRKYAPYYKWLHRGMADLEKAAVIMDIFNAVYDMPKGDERIRMTTEIVAAIIIEELERIGMAGNVPPQERFLDVYSQVIAGTQTTQ